MKMKNYLLPIVIGLCSCVNESSEVQVEEADTIEFSIASMDDKEVDSRLSVSDRAKVLFQNNDRLGIFPTNKGSQVEFVIELEEGQTTDAVTFDGGGWAFKSGYSYAAYYPYNLLNTKGNEIPFSFTGQCQVGNDNRDHLDKHVLLVAGPTDVKNASINFTLWNVESFMRIDLYLPGNKTYTSLSLYTNKSVIPQKKTCNIFSTKANNSVVTIDERVLETDNHLTIGLKDITTVSDNEKVRVWMTFPVVDLKGASMLAVVTDSEGHIYTGDLLVNSSAAPLFVSTIDRNEINLLKAYPVLNDGFTGRVSTYETNGFDWN